jgi:hypothetical protein
MRIFKSVFCLLVYERNTIKNRKIMKKLLFTLLALPMLATAQEKSVRVPTCEAGSAFTIKIPVKFPDSMTVQYAWYRNDTLIEGTHTLLLGEKAISYTIPASEAYGSAVYYFKYNLHDDHDGVWTRSPRYAVTFLASPPPQVVAIMGDTVVCSGSLAAYSTAYTTDTYYAWTIPAGWRITRGRNTSSITVRVGTAGGIVSVTPGSGSGFGSTHTLAVSSIALTYGAISSIAAYSCSNGVSDAGAISSLATYSCSGGVSDAGAVNNVAAYSCSNGVGDAGAISSIATYSCSGGVNDAGTVSSIAAYSCSGGLSSAGAISGITPAN